MPATPRWLRSPLPLRIGAAPKALVPARTSPVVGWESVCLPCVPCGVANHSPSQLTPFDKRSSRGTSGSSKQICRRCLSLRSRTILMLRLTILHTPPLTRTGRAGHAADVQNRLASHQEHTVRSSPNHMNPCGTALRLPGSEQWRGPAPIPGASASAQAAFPTR